MNNEIQFLGEKVIEKKAEIAEKVHKHRLAGISEEEEKQLAVIEQDILKMRADFIHLFGEALKQQLDKETTAEMISNWGKETGKAIYDLGIPLDEALKDTKFYRTFIWEAIKEEVKKHHMSVDTVFEAGSIIDPLLDEAIYYFSLTFVHFHQAALTEAKAAFMEVSVPVVPVTKEIAILPLIGNIDTDRAQLLMESALKAANNLKLSHLVLDLSGVLTVDTMVADQVFKVVSSLKLLGVETILTGLRPEAAQTLVSIGVNFSNVKTKATLQQALHDLYN
ncbi:STAS domain-containing protein [Bacillus aerolatus]|uniref:STAS domain-containing protein n=1 Tax=Bacillus aerolatus TaxID=2653354 RepID=A0A6I1FDI1_9BACI|nr:STAS domain-containing protein [Bacillus aerolatus]KAB7705581.1 STAS domain-containing protein [Bacillus aerolatus]